MADLLSHGHRSPTERRRARRIGRASSVPGGRTIAGKAVRDAIFLSGHTPVQLIAADLATVVAVAVVVGMQLRLKARMSTKHMLLISPFCFALGDFGLYFGMSRMPDDWMARVAYLWIGVQASFGAPQASLLGYHVLTLRQARRMCGVVGAGATLGWIGGGLLTELVAAHFGALSLLLGAGALTALCPVVVAAAWRAKSDTTLETNFRVHPDTSGDLRRSARFVWAGNRWPVLACRRPPSGGHGVRGGPARLGRSAFCRAQRGVRVPLDYPGRPHLHRAQTSGPREGHPAQ